MPVLLYSVVLFCLFQEGFVKTQNIGCRDEDNNLVDWYYVYKLPENFDTGSSIAVKSILRYLYMTSKDPQGDWRFSRYEIDDKFSIPGRTMSSVLKSYVLGSVLIAYNDEPPKGSVVTEMKLNDANGLGHTKGVIAADSKSGFWLVHSVPEFPLIGPYKFPSQQIRYGHSFLCISLNTKQIDLVGKQMLYSQQPNIYYHRFPIEFEYRLPFLNLVINSQWASTGILSTSSVLTLVTNEGQIFSSLAKFSGYQKEFYENLVAPTALNSLAIKSWQDQDEELFPSNCSTSIHLMNVKTIKGTIFESDIDYHVNFESNEDRSKWCVSKSMEDDWICVGDIDRNKLQLMRGGGIVCQQNLNVANRYRSLIKDIEPCSQQGD